MIAAALALALIPSRMPDVLQDSQPSQVHVGGYIGQRILNNEQNRLLEVDLKPLLEGFHHQPGSHPWIGEHIGKWIHASTLAWQNTGDKRLKTKLDAAVKELVSCQQADGYLGTYVPEKRFGLYPEADWDVWVHKYDLLGLLTYYRFTQDKASLQCCQRIGDLMIRTFGPGKKSILSAGTHQGTAATSTLEPMVLLYNASGDSKYLDFAKYIVDSWEEKGGPQIMTRLEAGRPINEVGNGKAYEMLSNLVGLCELARATGEKRYLNVAKLAWADVVKHELYITGSASYYEVFHPGDDLPNVTSKNVGETCVTVTWMQLCQQLFRLTGEAKYAAEFERSEYNHLAAAQRPDGKEWCYYTSLQGKKPFTGETCCCLSSGPRGMAIIPETAYLTSKEGKSSYLVVNTVESSSFTTGELSPFWKTKVATTSDFPAAGKMQLKIDATEHKNTGGTGSRPPVANFGLKIRVPRWMLNFQCSLPGKISDGWYVVEPRTWTKQSVSLSYDIANYKVDGTGSNKGAYATMVGPFVMALVSDLSAADSDAIRAAKVPSGTLIVEFQDHGSETYAPYSEAGRSGGTFQIWHRDTGPEHKFPHESRSAEGNVDGSIIDGDYGSFVVTWDQKLQREAWFAVSRDTPITISTLRFTHGRNFHDGGWFVNDAVGPRFEVQRVKGGSWELVGKVPGYPATTSTSPGKLGHGFAYELKLAKPIEVVAIRVIGTPASGDNPKQAFASCAELEASG